MFTVQVDQQLQVCFISRCDCTRMGVDSFWFAGRAVLWAPCWGESTAATALLMLLPLRSRQRESRSSQCCRTTDPQCWAWGQTSVAQDLQSTCAVVWTTHPLQTTRPTRWQTMAAPVPSSVSSSTVSGLVCDITRLKFLKPIIHTDQVNCNNIEYLLSMLTRIQLCLKVCRIQLKH